MKQQIVILAPHSRTDRSRHVRRVITTFLAAAILAVLVPASASASGNGPCNTDADCVDANVCTTDVCVNGTCSHVPNSESCDDGLACTADDVCSAGFCSGTPSCPEGSGCNLFTGACMLDDGDNDGLPDVDDPCPADERNACYGPVATDGDSGLSIRVNANVSGAECSGDKTDCNGDMWHADFGYNLSTQSEVCPGGEDCVISGIGGLFGCDDEETEDLFQCGHWDDAADPELAYSFSVPANNYLVNLYFANTFPGTSQPGDRVFDIAIEGAVVYDDFDQIVAAGGADRTAVVRTAIVSVVDGTLDIELLHQIENPSIRAIEVLEAGECITDADCDDADACNGAETCRQWTCEAGQAPVCDDGLFCNGAETCDAALGCVPGQAPSTDDGVACTVDSCDEEADTIVNTADDSLCDDGQFCNGAETCDAALDCQAGIAPTTDDGIGCTVDTCDDGRRMH